jgi:hypothetical protein
VLSHARAGTARKNVRSDLTKALHGCWKILRLNSTLAQHSGENG